MCKGLEHRQTEQTAAASEGDSAEVLDAVLIFSKHFFALVS